MKELEGGGQVPHLDGAVAVASEDEPAGPGAHPCAALALVNTETRDDRAVHRSGNIQTVQHY